MPQTVVIQQESTSGIATAGLIFSILGWFTCGLLCIPGAFLSFLGLFSRGPKGIAVAGLIVGFPGTLFFVFFGCTVLLGVLGIGGAATVVHNNPQLTVQQPTAIAKSGTILSMPSIPGLMPVDVYLNFSNKPGFVLEKRLGGNQKEWRCKQELSTQCCDVEVFGETTSSVTVVEGTYINYSLSADATDDNASDFLGYLATIPYKGSQPQVARDWVVSNISRHNAQTVIGGVSLQIFAKAPRVRMLRIAVADKPQVVEKSTTAVHVTEIAQDNTIRTWKDVSGNFSVEARFQGMASGVAKLERKNGSVISVPIEKLSQADRDWIDRLKK